MRIRLVALVRTERPVVNVLSNQSIDTGSNRSSAVRTKATTRIRPITALCDPLRVNSISYLCYHGESMYVAVSGPGVNGGIFCWRHNT